MKLLTLNFLTCAIKSCKPLPAAFPLHVRDAELESVEVEYNPLFLRNVLGRLDWAALEVVAGEVGLRMPLNPLERRVVAGDAAAGIESAGEDMDVDVTQDTGETQGKRKSRAQEEEEQQKKEEENIPEEVLKQLHSILIETQILSGKLVCGNCGHEYAVREGIPNFLLPAHLV